MIVCMYISVYLRADPKVCQERIRNRNRNEEKDVPLVSANNLDTFKLKVYGKTEMVYV